MRTLPALLLVIATACSNSGGVNEPSDVARTVTCRSNTGCAPTEFCDTPVCGGEGFCVPRPTTCPDSLTPTCGCDGVTYGNDCTRSLAGVARKGFAPCAQSR